MKSRNFIYAKSRMKYKNIHQTVDNINFDSKLEARYYQQLKMEKRAGLIKGFERQKSFDLFALYDSTKPDSWYPHRVCSHIVDFLVTLPDGSLEVREVKGFSTSTWDLKRKIFEANYPTIPYKVVRYVR